MKESLIRTFADAYDEMIDPFDGSMLAQNDVSADDCFAMSTLIAGLLRGYLASPPRERAAFVFRGVASGTGLPQDAIDHAVARMALPDATDRLIAQLKRLSK